MLNLAEQAKYEEPAFRPLPLNADSSLARNDKCDAIAKQQLRLLHVNQLAVGIEHALHPHLLAFVRLG